MEATTNGALSNAIKADGHAYEPLDCVDAGRMPGFLHLRHSLLNDYSFDWADAASGEHDWGYLIRFRDDAKTATLLISRDFGYALLVETGAKACVRPVGPGIEQVLGDRSRASGF
ncbi:MAG TPA: hypothetical protein VNH11_22025 [Pirellulales bacterium]|nr:hypothetical protein [Pirellulales bacterium]